MTAAVIAFIGCDGAGKSTLVKDLCSEISATRRVEACYLGLGSGTLGKKIARLPLIGRAAERLFDRKAKRTRTSGDRIPGPATALVVYAFSLARRRRFRRMLALQRRGVVVLTDRYPQIEIPGFYDGPGLSAAQAGGHFVAALAAQERRMYLRMASHQPDIVIRLNIDLPTATARKPDHDPDLLRRKIDATPKLHFGGARIIDIDARAGYADVRREVLRAIALTIDAADETNHGAGHSVHG